MYIIIDGYNVIGIRHADLNAERQRFIDALIRYKKRKGHEIAVVFDGWKGGGMKEGRSVTGGVEVVYSAIGEKADTVIKRIVSERRGPEALVVSSDREVQAYAWAADAVPVRSDVFLEAIEGNGCMTETEEENISAGRGRAFKPSKKEKAVRRALGKL